MKISERQFSLMRGDTNEPNQSLVSILAMDIDEIDAIVLIKLKLDDIATLGTGDLFDVHRVQ